MSLAWLFGDIPMEIDPARIERDMTYEAAVEFAALRDTLAQAQQAIAKRDHIIATLTDRLAAAESKNTDLEARLAKTEADVGKLQPKGA